MCRVYRPLSAEYKYFENLIDTCNTGRLYADDDVNLTMMGESLSSSPVCFIENLKSFCSYQRVQSVSLPHSYMLFSLTRLITVSDQYIVYTVVNSQQSKFPPRTITHRRRSQVVRASTFGARGGGGLIPHRLTPKTHVHHV